jgi:hypothetical protein
MRRNRIVVIVMTAIACTHQSVTGQGTKSS